MHLRKLSVLNFKNIQEAELTFSPHINCFFGKNGEGKTNLLDVVYYLSFCKSHSNPIDAQVLLHDMDYFMLRGAYQVHDRSMEIQCSMKKRQRKIFKKDKKEYSRLSEHIGQIPLVLISPSDEGLIREGSEERRKFMDMVLSQYDHEYMETLIAYNKALQQRNALIKQESDPDRSMWELYESMMYRYGKTIFEKRKAFVDAFTPVFQKFYQRISGGNENISLVYNSHLEDEHYDLSLEQNRNKDRLIGFTMLGIHKDDLDMKLDGFPIKRVGSQGQNKSYLIALKLAQYIFLSEAGPYKPILLLDDLFDKLDAQRVSNIIQLISGGTFGQIFITDTNRENPEQLLHQSGKEYKIFMVEKGQIKSVEA